MLVLVIGVAAYSLRKRNSAPEPSASKVSEKPAKQWEVQI